MDVIKYFYEEPVALEALSADADPDARRREGPTMPLEALLSGPRYYRGYLAGTRLADGASAEPRVGLTAVDAPGVAADALLAYAAERPGGAAEGGTVRWWRAGAQGTAARVEPADVHALLLDPTGTSALAAAAALDGPGALVAAAGDDRRRAVPALRLLLAQAALVLFPEPAHDGWDWSFFAPSPVRDALQAHLRGGLQAEQRLFVLPYQRARGEHKFYFELYDLDRFADYEVHGAP